jgi:hypothetical protein
MKPHSLLWPMTLAMLALAPPLCAQAPAATAQEIRAGRSALQAGQPQVARERFAAALAQPGASREDRYAAAIGLGRATLWLGDYPAALDAFGQAANYADQAADHQAADTGLAQALNALDYPRQAYAKVAPFARGQARPTLELLRALKALGWQDKSPAYVQATPPPEDGGYLGTHYRLLQEDMRYALAPRVEARFGYSHDNEQLDTYSVGARFDSVPTTVDSQVRRWGGASASTWVSDGNRTQRLDAIAALGQWRLHDRHRIDLDLGLGRSGHWRYLQGAARWTVESSDRFSLSTAAEHAPVLTGAAIAQRLTIGTYSAGVSLRPTARWYLLPTGYHQVFSDGNRRDGGSLRVLFSPHDIAGTAAAMGAQFSTRLFHSSRPSRGAYFNPARYRATELGLTGVYGFGPRWKLRASANAGRQFIDGEGAAIYSVNLSLDGRLPHNGRLALQLGRSSAASIATGGAGYWNNQLALSLSYPF